MGQMTETRGQINGPNESRHVLPLLVFIGRTRYGYYDTYIITLHAIIDQYAIRRMCVDNWGSY